MITIQTGRNGMEMVEATIAYSQDPSEQNKRRLDSIHNKMDTESSIINSRKEREFLLKWGSITTNFIKSLFPEEKYPFIKESFYWNIKSDYDNEDHWQIRWREGKFRYEKLIASGYAGIEVLEDNLSFDRVLELFKSREL
jgi:hypothetical protein